jgi:hypothetical protein
MTVIITVCVTLTKCQKYPWQAAMTPLWVNQLPTMGANKHVKICQKFHETSMETSAFLLSVALSEATVRLSREIH